MQIFSMLLQFTLRMAELCVKVCLELFMMAMRGLFGLLSGLVSAMAARAKAPPPPSHRPRKRTRRRKQWPKTYH